MKVGADPGGSDSSHAGFITTEVVLPGIVEPSGLRIESRALESPRPRQAVVKVEATGISFAERAMRLGIYYGQPAFPFVPGYDVVGIVAAVGRDVDLTLVGKRVAALMKTGGWADDVLRSADELMPVPDGVDASEAETLVVSGIRLGRCCIAKPAFVVAKRLSFMGPTEVSGLRSCN